MDYFLQIYGSLPRAGPGSDALTQRAYRSMRHLPDSPKILDVGCGPGAQTVELLRLGAGNVTALDFLPEMIDRVNERAQDAGVSECLEPVVQDMNDMAFPDHSFDVIWSEGAIYNIGFAQGLKQFNQFLRPGGYMAVSEVVWLKNDPPAPVVEFWSEYPEIDAVAAKLDVIEKSGYEVIEYFVFPTSAWTEEYYDPMAVRIAEKEKDWRGIPEAEAVLQEAKDEISIFRDYSDYFSYAFFVMRSPG